MIDIAMLTCNRRRLALISILEISRRTSFEFRLLVLDNGSIDGTPDMLRDLEKKGLIHELILSEENTGVHFGFNELLRRVTSFPYYICTDGDLIPCDRYQGLDWLDRLIDLADTYPEYGAIACRPHILIGEPSDRFDRSGDIREMSHIGAHLRIMDTGLVRKVGGWKGIKSHSRNNEDWWIGGKIREADRKVGYARDVRCIHLFGDPEHREEDPWGYPRKDLRIEQAILIRELLEEQPPFGKNVPVEVFIDGRLAMDHGLVVTPRHSVSVVVAHGHVPRWPPVHNYSWERMGVNYLTCES